MKKSVKLQENFIKQAKEESTKSTQYKEKKTMVDETIEFPPACECNDISCSWTSWNF